MKVRLAQVRNIWQATGREGEDGHAEGLWEMPDL